MTARRAAGILRPLAFLALAAMPVAGASPACAAPALAEVVPVAPGQYLWNDSEGGDGGSLSIVIDLPAQRMHVYRGSALIGVSAVSTGMPGHDTPPGDYRILQKNRWHRSNLYSDAPMPFMQRLTWDGIAIHAGWNPGYPASHGCIRVPAGFARKLFEATELGAGVSIVDGTAAPVHLRFDDLIWAVMEDDGVIATGMAMNDAVSGTPVRLDYAPGIFMDPADGRD